jgi:uncharacterized LabA/DUF88 family protein
MSGLIPKPQRESQVSEPASWDEPSLEVEAPNVLSESSQVRHPLRVNQRDRVVVLVDGSNLFYAASILSIGIDYARLLEFLVGGRRLVRAYFYTGVDRSNEKQQGFLLWMSRNGYRVVAKELIQFPDGSRKANLDVEMAIDMLTMSDCCDTIVLLSGDGDLAYAVNSVTYQGVRVEVVSLHSMTSDSLINVADLYTDLAMIKNQVQREENNREPQSPLHPTLRPD